jgi:hypothetical protein
MFPATFRQKNSITVPEEDFAIKLELSSFILFFCAGHGSGHRGGAHYSFARLPLAHKRTLSISMACAHSAFWSKMLIRCLRRHPLSSRQTLSESRVPFVWLCCSLLCASSPVSRGSPWLRFGSSSSLGSVARAMSHHEQGYAHTSRHFDRRQLDSNCGNTCLELVLEEEH